MKVGENLYIRKAPQGKIYHTLEVTSRLPHIHAQIGPQGTEKQLRKVHVGVYRRQPMQIVTQRLMFSVRKIFIFGINFAVQRQRRQSM